LTAAPLRTLVVEYPSYSLDWDWSEWRCRFDPGVGIDYGYVQEQVLGLVFDNEDLPSDLGAQDLHWYVI